MNLAQSMKRFLLLILSVCYLTASSGAVVHLHYCMDKLIGWGLWEKNGKTDKCDKCGMSKSSKKKSCCKDKSKFVKITKDQKAIKGCISLSRPVLNLTTGAYHYSSFEDIVIITCKHSVSHDPPSAESLSLLILNRVFRI